ncbi:DUF4129 domain-containing protein [Paenibacillus wynnii]|uniref:DUF4129 domain-containing protein n=1 Tax=Paenibacillus wynnii TaxID=268407 RepID=UPI00278D10F5|nr:DUF4129 domain-containing protein [Paenibacillus wynnii]MDQ0194366.1 hypothetical protein [Paenibacillus wynnii]
MKPSSVFYLKETVKIWISCLIELMMVLPIWVLFQVYILPAGIHPIWMSVLPLLTLTGILLRSYFHIRWKQLIGSLLLGVGIGLITGGTSMSAISMTVAGCTCSYLGMTAVSRYHSFRIYWVGIALYFMAAIFFQRIPELQENTALITKAGILCVVLALLMTNRNHLRYSSLSGESSPLPQGLRRHNQVFVFLFVIITALLAAGMGKIVGLWVWNSVRNFLGWIIRLFSNTSPPPVQEEAPPAVMPEMPIGESNDPGLLAHILNISFYILGIAAVGALSYLTLRWLYRNTGGIWRRAIEALLTILRREQSPRNINAYIDEEKSVFTWEKTVQGIKDFWRSKLAVGTRRDLWENMNSSKERVRWLYRQWLRSKREKGYEAKSYLTPRETEEDVLKWASSQIAPDKLLEMYEKARYGEIEPSAADVAALKEQLKV